MTRRAEGPESFPEAESLKLLKAYSMRGKVGRKRWKSIVGKGTRENQVKYL